VSRKNGKTVQLSLPESSLLPWLCLGSRLCCQSRQGTHTKPESPERNPRRALLEEGKNKICFPPGLESPRHLMAGLGEKDHFGFAALADPRLPSSRATTSNNNLIPGPHEQRWNSMWLMIHVFGCACLKKKILKKFAFLR